MTFTAAQKRRIKLANVGFLESGIQRFKAVPVATHDTGDVARAIFDNYDPELEFKGQMQVEWCPHSADYAYEHGCYEGCERPVPKLVWYAEYPREP